MKENARDLAAAKAATGELRGTLNEARAARQAAERQVRDCFIDTDDPSIGWVHIIGTTMRPCALVSTDLAYSLGTDAAC